MLAKPLELEASALGSSAFNSLLLELACMHHARSEVLIA